MTCIRDRVITMIEESMEKKVLIVMPTVNHFEIVDQWLQIYEKNSVRHRFNVLVIDSSKDDNTRKVCEKYSLFVRYEKFESYGKENSLKEMDDKALYAFLESGSEYIWLTSDARIPNVDYCYEIIEKELDGDTDLVHFFYTRSNMNANYIRRHPERTIANKIFNIKEINYKKNNLNDLFLDFFWSISTYGISIVRRNLIQKKYVKHIKEAYSGLSFLYPAMIFDCLSRQDSIKCKVINHGCFIANRLRKVNTWKASGDAVKVYSEHVVKIIENLPQFYDVNKKQVISEFAINNMHMTYVDIIEWRKQGYYNLREFWKYRKYIRRVAEKNNIVMFFIAIMPTK